jgi:hypothetical protein
VEVGNNYFSGTSGANLVEVEPQNSNSDERMRYLVLEDNVVSATGSQAEEGFQMSATYSSIRNNGMVTRGAYGIQIGQRGIEPVPNLNEIFNNSIQYLGAGNAPSSLIQINGTGGANPTGTHVQNNLGYDSRGGVPMVTDGGTGSVISNNTTSVTSNPDFIDASGTFRYITDYKPTAAYTGGVAVPDWFDALGIAWLSTWYLGAVDPL